MDDAMDAHPDAGTPWTTVQGFDGLVRQKMFHHGKDGTVLPAPEEMFMGRKGKTRTGKHVSAQAAYDNLQLLLSAPASTRQPSHMKRRRSGQQEQQQQGTAKRQQASKRASTGHRGLSEVEMVELEVGKAVLNLLKPQPQRAPLSALPLPNTTDSSAQAGTTMAASAPSDTLLHEFTFNTVPQHGSSRRHSDAGISAAWFLPGSGQHAGTAAASQETPQADVPAAAHGSSHSHAAAVGPVSRSSDKGPGKGPAKFFCALSPANPFGAQAMEDSNTDEEMAGGSSSSSGSDAEDDDQRTGVSALGRTTGPTAAAIVRAAAAAASATETVSALHVGGLRRSSAAAAIQNQHKAATASASKAAAATGRASISKATAAANRGRRALAAGNMTATAAGAGAGRTIRGKSPAGKAFRSGSGSAGNGQAQPAAGKGLSSKAVLKAKANTQPAFRL